MKNFKVGIDNYSLYPLKLSPIETLRWAKEHSADGVAFSGLDAENRARLDRAYLQDMKSYAAENDLYIEWGGAQHIPREMNTWTKKELTEINRKTAQEAQILGTRIVRSCSGGLMRWHPDSPFTDTLLKETAQTLKSQRRMLEDFGVVLAIETHFEFTTFELLRLFETSEAEPGGYLGICLDTMNLLTMLEHPLSAIERIRPYVVSTHIKDGALIIAEDGLTTFPTAIGEGVIDFPSLLRSLDFLPDEVNLSIEDHGGQFHLPIFDTRFLSEFPDLSTAEFATLIRLAQLSLKKDCSILPREEWQLICEDRLHQDIILLKQIVNGLS